MADIGKEITFGTTCRFCNIFCSPQSLFGFFAIRNIPEHPLNSDPPVVFVGYRCLEDFDINRLVPFGMTFDVVKG